PSGRRSSRAKRHYSWKAFQKRISPNCWSRMVLIPTRSCSLGIRQTVAKFVYYPKQDETIHTIAGKQLWAATIEGKPNQTSQGSNRSFPNDSGEHASSSAATATPSQWPCRSLA